MTIQDDITYLRSLIPQINSEKSSKRFIQEVTDLDRRIQSITVGDEWGELINSSPLSISQPLKEAVRQLQPIVQKLSAKPKDANKLQGKQVHEVTELLEKVVAASEKTIPILKLFNEQLAQAKVDGKQVSENIDTSQLPEEMRAKIAIAVAEQNPNAVAQYIENYKITDPTLLFTVVTTLYEKVLSYENQKKISGLLPKAQQIREISAVMPELVMQNLKIFKNDFLAANLFDLGITDFEYLYAMASQLIEAGHGHAIKEGFWNSSLNIGDPKNHDLADKLVRKLVAVDLIDGEEASKLLIKEIQVKNADPVVGEEFIDVEVDEARVQAFVREMKKNHPEWLLKNLSDFMPYLDGTTLYEIALKFHGSKEVLELLPDIQKKITAKQYGRIAELVFGSSPKVDSHGTVIFDPVEYLALMYKKMGEGVFKEPPSVIASLRGTIFSHLSFDEPRLQYIIEGEEHLGFTIDSTKAPNDVIAQLLEELKIVLSSLESSTINTEMLNFVIFYDLVTQACHFSKEQLESTLPLVISILKLCDPPLQYSLLDLLLPQVQAKKTPSQAQEQIEKILIQEHTRLFTLMLTPLVEANPNKDWEFLALLNDQFFMTPDKQHTILAALNAIIYPPVHASENNKFQSLKDMFTCKPSEIETLSKQINEKNKQNLQCELVIQHFNLLTAMTSQNPSFLATERYGMAGQFPSQFLRIKHKHLIDKHLTRLDPKQNAEALQIYLLFKMYYASLLDSTPLSSFFAHFEGIHRHEAVPVILEYLRTFKKIKDPSLTEEERQNLSRAIAQLEFDCSLKKEEGSTKFKEMGLKAHQEVLKFPQKDGKIVGSMILTSGIIEHSILYKIEMNELGATFSVINTGKGATHISEKPSKTRGTVKTSRDEVYSGIDPSALSPEFFEELFKLQINTESMDGVFAFLDKTLLLSTAGVNKVAGPERIRQGKGTCTVRCVYVWLRETLGKDLFREYDASSSEHIKVNVEVTVKKIKPFVKPILVPTVFRGMPDEAQYKKYLDLFLAKGRESVQRKKGKLNKGAVTASWSLSRDMQSFQARITNYLRSFIS